jgi:hypothetical protein
VRNSNGGLKIRWFATSAEAVAASRHREFVMDDALAKRLDEMSHMLRAILDRLPAQTASAPVPADQLLESEDAAKLMGYSRANAFIAAARKAGIHHAGTRRRFLWNPADLARWQAAPKEARKWRTLPAIDARAVHRRRAP